MRMSESVRSFRESVEDVYKIPKGSFIVSKISDNQFSCLLNAGATLEDVSKEDGLTLLY